MTRMAFLLAVFAAVVFLDMTPSHAGTYGHAPWCAVQNLGMGDVQWDCEYATAAACAPAVAGGNRGFCNRNPYFAEERGPAPRYQHRRRYYR